MSDYRDCIGFNKLEGKVEKLDTELKHVRYWSDEKDDEMEAQFRSLKEAQDKMWKHYDQRVDKLEVKIDRVTKSQENTASDVKVMQKSLSTMTEQIKWLVKLIAGALITGALGVVFYIIRSLLLEL